MAAMQTAIVIGVGPERGLGAQLCLRFAREGLHVVASGRTRARVEAVAEAIRAAGGSAEAVAADAGSESDVRELFERAPGDLELAVYNAGNATLGKIAELEAEAFEKSWRVVCFGGFLFGREALRRMLPRGRGVILFTGASGSLRGSPNFGAFNSAKGALRNLAQSMAKEAGPEGVHVAHVIVDGIIDGDKFVKRRPQVADELGSEGMVSLEGIADAFVYLYRQPSRAWSFELDLRTSRESW